VDLCDTLAVGACWAWVYSAPSHPLCTVSGYRPQPSLPLRVSCHRPDHHHIIIITPPPSLYVCQLGGGGVLGVGALDASSGTAISDLTNASAAAARSHHHHHAAVSYCLPLHPRYVLDRC
jgi:hypothetical protein